MSFTVVDRSSRTISGRNLMDLMVRKSRPACEIVPGVVLANMAGRPVQWERHDATS
jgi:hypothetical protein